MSPIILFYTIIAYFMILFAISYIAGHKADNEGFFVGNRKSAWYIVAFAMIGSTISGVTLYPYRVWYKPAASPTCNGTGIYRRTVHYRIHTRSAFLPDESGFYL